MAVLPEGEVIALAGLMVNANPRMHHSARIALYVHKAYQRMGIGTALLTTLLNLADNWLMLVRIELEVFADNEGAIHLYEQMGFQKEGLKRMATTRNGQYADEYIMARLRSSTT